MVDKADWNEIPEGQMIRGTIDDYEHLLTELRLAVEVDGSKLVDPEGSFGLMVNLQFTEEVGASSGGFSKYLVNSLIIESSSTVLAITIGTLAAYAFSRFPIYGEKHIFFFILTTRMCPPVVVALPLFIIFFTCITVSHKM